jgi:hypothetical protein
LQRQRLASVFAATIGFCRDRIQKHQARTLSASRDGESLDGEWVELPKTGAREGAVARFDCSERRGHFQQLLLAFWGA